MAVKYTADEREQIALSRGILVDQEDAWLLREYTWSVTRDGYAYTEITTYNDEGYRVRTHSLLHHCIIGQPIWEGEEIDHIDRNPLNNKRYNLRYASLSLNRINTGRPDNEAGARHVYIRKGRYAVRIRRNRLEHYVGAYATLNEAIAARDTWLATNDTMEDRYGRN